MGLEKIRLFGQFGGDVRVYFFADGEHEISEKHILKLN